MSQRLGAALAVSALAWINPGAAQTTPADAAAVEDATIPAALEWRVSANLQGDGLAASDLPADRTDRAELRRARLAALLQWHQAWRLTASADFAHQARLRDLFAEWRGDRLFVALGRFPEPFGLSAGEGSRAVPFMERAQPTALGPGYGLGGALSLRGDNWGGSLGYFAASGSPSDEDVLTGARREDALTGRLTSTPWRGDDGLLHLGLSASLRKPREDAIRFVAIPESTLVSGLNASTGAIPGDRYTLFGTEAAWRQGPVLVQSEFIGAKFPQYFDVAPFYRGYYVEGAWALTGERRDYSTRRGVFGPVNPDAPLFESGYGAFELALRYSYTNLADNVFGTFFDGTPYQQDVDAVFSGRRGQVVSAGLNWYATENLRATLDALSIQKTSEQERERAFAVQLRLQAQFSAP
jgi:phosphate-selective porin OprO/OprP